MRHLGGTGEATKSRAEISASYHLRKLYDALLVDPRSDDSYEQNSNLNAWSPQRTSVGKARPQSARAFSKSSGPAPSTSISSGNVAVDAIRTLRRQHQRSSQSQSVTVSAAKSPSKFNYMGKATSNDAALVFTKWIALATTISSLEADVGDLQREIRASELKCAELQHKTCLSTIERISVDPKLQCLEEILGERDFQRYLHDLHRETALFRCHFGLYGRRFQCFQRRVWETHDKRVTKETCLEILNKAVSSLSIGPEGTTTTSSDSVVLLSQYPVLVQHCLNTQHPDRIVLTELLKLLSTLPMGRDTLVRHLFEQISDGRRGEGTKPPPDSVRPHKLMALAKQSLASGLCSKSEFDEVAFWLSAQEGEGSPGISLNSFLRFHIETSDGYCTEDAEFVTYLMRMWSFQVTQDLNGGGGGDDDNGDLCIQEVLKCYETRCQQAIASARKEELVTKIQNSIANHLTKFRVCEVQVQELQVLQVNNPPVWKSIQNTSCLAAKCASSLTLLKVLVLSSQCLQVFPGFITSLKQLEVLDLSDNLISSFPPEIEQLQSLQKLALAANRLTDKSFHGLNTKFAKLAALSELHLANNQLTTLPRAIPMIPSLTVLDLSKNQLKSLPSTVLQQWEGKCQLVTLDLHHNVLASVPEELSVMRATLRHLILHENKLETLPAAISLMPTLDTLTLANNALGSGLQMYPATLTQRQITLNNNQLRTFPALKYGVKTYLEGTPSSVLSINASWNRIHSIPTGALGLLLPLCEELNLYHNSLQELPEDLFHVLPGLRVCKFGSNQLHKLPGSIVSCRLLEVLDLQQNRILALPPELARLRNLVVLNVMENQVSEIPSEWHAFASNCDVLTGKRVLQTLALKKNPIRSQALKTLIDGGSVDTSAAAIATTKPNDEHICEFAVKKLIDALHSALEVLAMEDLDSAGGASDDEFGPGESEPQGAGRRQWKGMTRNVNKYLESRLQTIQTAEKRKVTSEDSYGSYLHVSERAFRRLLKSLPGFTCSEKEMTSLVSQFMVVRKNPRNAGETMVQGYAFLLAIDQFGQHRTLSSAPAPANSSFAISKPGDPVASILHYLSIVYNQQQQETERLASPKKTKKEYKAKGSKTRVNYVQRNKSTAKETRPLTVEASSPRATSTAHRQSQHHQVDERGAQAKVQFLQRHLDPEHEVLMRRQKQRIQILEQQLMDQKLLLLSQQTQGSKGGSELAPANSISGSDEDEEGRVPEVNAGDHRTRTKKPEKLDDESPVLVCVKCAKGQEDLPVLRRWRTDGPLCFSLSLNSPISAVKERIERETQIPVANQVLISSTTTTASAVSSRKTGGGIPARVRSDGVVSDYLEMLTIERKMKWHVTLLVGERLRLFSAAQELR